MDIQNTEINPVAEVGDLQAADRQDGGDQGMPTQSEIQTWLSTYLAELLDIKLDEVDVKIPFERYGLDSAAAIGLTGDLADWLGRDLEPSLANDYRTIELLSQYLAAI